MCIYTHNVHLCSIVKQLLYTHACTCTCTKASRTIFLEINVYLHVHVHVHVYMYFYTTPPYLTLSYDLVRFPPIP